MIIITSFCDDGRDMRAQIAVSDLAKRYPILGHGLYRAAFKIGKHVFKFPLNEGGEYCNDGEGSIRHPWFAKGRYISFRGFICVMQEFVEPCSGDELWKLRRLPEYDWFGCIDGEQVGFARNGAIKAYDFVHP